MKIRTDTEGEIGAENDISYVKINTFTNMERGQKEMSLVKYLPLELL